MDPPVLLPPSIDEIPPPGMALVEELDKLLMVQVRRRPPGRAPGLAAWGDPDACSPTHARALLSQPPAFHSTWSPLVPTCSCADARWAEDPWDPALL